MMLDALGSFLEIPVTGTEDAVTPVPPDDDSAGAADDSTPPVAPRGNVEEAREMMAMARRLADPDLLFVTSEAYARARPTLTRAERAFLEKLRQWDVFQPERARSVIRECPASLRALAWRRMLGSTELERTRAGEYEALLQQSTPAEAAIRKDVHRTLSYDLFSADEEREEKQEALFRVLRAFAVLEPSLGYCQGMSYVAGQLLLFMPEREAFWAFSQTMRVHALGGFFMDGLPLLRLCLYCLDRLIERRLPHLFSHFKILNVTPLLFASHWFSTLYTYALPVELAAKVWDVFFVEGLVWLFKVALAILKMVSEELQKRNFEEVLEFMKTAPGNLDGAALLRTADSMSIVTPELVAQLRAEYTHPSMASSRQFL